MAPSSTLSFAILRLSLFSIFSYSLVAQVAAVTTTLDDSSSQITYRNGFSAVGDGLECSIDCGALPDDITQLTRETYHYAFKTLDSTNPSFTVTFTGVGLDGTGVLVDKLVQDDNGDLINTNTDLQITVDGSPFRVFRAADNTLDQFQYNATLFSISGLTNTRHELTVELQGESFLVLDTLIIHEDDGDDRLEVTESSDSTKATTSASQTATTESGPPMAMILGPAIAAAITGTILLIVAGFFTYRALKQRRNRVQAHDRSTPVDLDGRPSKSSGWVDPRTLSNTNLSKQDIELGILDISNKPYFTYYENSSSHSLASPTFRPPSSRWNSVYNPNGQKGVVVVQMTRTVERARNGSVSTVASSQVLPPLPPVPERYSHASTQGVIVTPTTPQVVASSSTQLQPIQPPSRPGQLKGRPRGYSDTTAYAPRSTQMALDRDRTAVQHPLAQSVTVRSSSVDSTFSNPHPFSAEALNQTFNIPAPESTSPLSNNAQNPYNTNRAPSSGSARKKAQRRRSLPESLNGPSRPPSTCPPPYSLAAQDNEQSITPIPPVPAIPVVHLNNSRSQGRDRNPLPPIPISHPPAAPQSKRLR